MRSFIKFIIIICASIYMTACATTAPHNHLDARARPHIKTVDTVLFAKQNQIGADVKKGSEWTKIIAISQGNVIPLLVDAGITGIRTISANSNAKPIRERLEGFDFPVEFREHIKQSMANSRFGDVGEVKLRRSEYEGFRGHYIQNSDADAVLFVDMKYAFTPKFDKLYVATSAMMFPKKAELTPYQEERGSKHHIEITDNIYRNQFIAMLSPEDKEGSKSDNVAYWEAQTEEDLIRKLQAAALRLADVMADDISIDDVTGLPPLDDPVDDTAPRSVPNGDIDLENEDIAALEAEVVGADQDDIADTFASPAASPEIDADS